MTEIARPTPTVPCHCATRFQPNRRLASVLISKLVQAFKYTLHDPVAALGHEPECLRRSRSGNGIKLLAYQSTRAMQAYLDVVFGQIQRGCNFSGSHVLDVAQHE